MIRALKTAGAAAVLAITASVAGAAAPSSVGPVAEGVDNSLVRVHGYHRSCERGPGGWHRHNQWGERRPCRRWDGRGRRPDYCVRVGPIWYCDF
jgi:hypothetical protein